MNEYDWDQLVERIKAGRCTPFLGAGACGKHLPAAAKLAKKWAKKHDYPLADDHDLARVAQFMGVRYDPMRPKDELEKAFAAVRTPDFKAADEPHALLAELQLPVYLTTNYVNFMSKALSAKKKDPQREICRWNSLLKTRKIDGHGPLFDDGFEPTPANPVVFHLHGVLGITESLVLTEDDYLDFLIALTQDQESPSPQSRLLPEPIETAVTGSSLLFIGYRLADWDFRVLHRGLVLGREGSLRRLSVTVQLPETKPERQEYLDRYFNAMNLRVYWGKAEDFVTELRARLP
jgi:hypothetical protein